MNTQLTADNKLKKLIVVGDKVLVKPKKESDKTSSGIFLPPGVKEKEKVQSGYVVKAGPGYPIPLPLEEEGQISASANFHLRSDWDLPHDLLLQNQYYN